MINTHEHTHTNDVNIVLYIRETIPTHRGLYAELLNSIEFTSSFVVWEYFSRVSFGFMFRLPFFLSSSPSSSTPSTEFTLHAQAMCAITFWMYVLMIFNIYVFHYFTYLGQCFSSNHLFSVQFEDVKDAQIHSVCFVYSSKKNKKINKKHFFCVFFWLLLLLIFFA